MEDILFNFEDACKRRRHKKEEKALEGHGGVAQLGEHLPCTQGVRSSILLISTMWSKRDKNEGSRKEEVLRKWAHSSGG